jgi:hypothetical protein
MAEKKISKGKGKGKAKKTKAPKISYKKPDHANKSAAYWKKMFQSANAARKEGWRQYYEENQERWEYALKCRRLVKEDGGTVCSGYIPTHIKDLFIQMFSKLDGEAKECPICYEPVTVETTTLTNCGHIFHASCLEPHKTCPQCRRKL